MGQIWIPNKSLSIELLLILLNKVESKIDMADDKKDCNSWIVFHCYAVVSYVVSLRGIEGFLLNLSVLNRHW